MLQPSSLHLVEGERVVIVGSGPVGMRFATELLKKRPGTKLTMLGNEPVQPYDRVLLSPLLAGQLVREDIDLSLPSLETHPNFRFQVATVVSIHPETKHVLDNLGERYDYDHLVLATGARAHIPNIPGNDLQGVYRFRTLLDAERISARIVRSVNTVVLGGGLLGLEAAKAMQKAGTKVTVVQQGEWLMNRQLNESASALLCDEVKKAGIGVITNTGVREVLGEQRVESVRLHSGEVIPCDTLVMCAGISPNKELALHAGIKVGRGIQIDDQLETSHESIYAIGECCEHLGMTYGLVSPGYEQASILAAKLAGEDAVYKGSSSVARLKVLGQSVSSMGDVVEPAKRPGLQELSYQGEGVYRKLTLLRGRLIGALSFGDWPEASRVQSSYQNHFYVWPWQRWYFKRTGKLWRSEPSNDVAQWPAKAVVCNCRQVSKGELGDVIGAGASSLEEVQRACGASSVCGTCKPLVSQLIATSSGNDAAVSSAEAAWKTLIVASLLAIIVAAILVFVDGLPVADSVQNQGWFEGVWNDKFWKQVTGFSLLGMTLIGLLMSLRKRFNFAWMGKFAYWRAAHTLLGLGCISLLIMHTGLHLGNNLNQWLMIDFLSLVALGSLAAVLVAVGHKLPPNWAIRLKRYGTWAHVIVSWPLPALLCAHILSVYYF